MAEKETIAVRGLGPLIRDFSKLSKEASKQLRDELRKVAAPVAIDAKFREQDYGSKEPGGVKVVVRQRGVAVEQTLRRSPLPSRNRRNFGELQMRNVFIPALEDNVDVVNRRVEEFLDRFTSEGFGGAI